MEFSLILSSLFNLLISISAPVETHEPADIPAVTGTAVGSNWPSAGSAAASVPAPAPISRDWTPQVIGDWGTATNDDWA